LETHLPRHRWRATSYTLLSLICIACLGSCSGEANLSESGVSQCTDGQDNDKDTKIDCMDPDCFPMAFCMGPRDGGTDHFVMLDGPVTPPDRGLADSEPPRPDLVPASSYGTRCIFQKEDGITTCKDGQTYCVPSDYSPGFCTHKCAGMGASCPSGPAGTKTYCGYHVYSSSSGSWGWFCAFLCNSNSCPPDLTCTSTSGGSFCF
jgi:hypothetical protein